MSDCDISEVIIYNRVLTASELNSVGLYLEDKYGITTTYLRPASIVSFGLPGNPG